MRQDREQFIPHGSFLEPWAFVAQGVTGAAIERPFEGVLEDLPWFSLDPSTPLRSAQDDTGQGCKQGDASPAFEKLSMIS